ncbi:MAG: hypothetical protein JW803_05755 [Endomicrobiales bacterium]|nr:hypothetical protein [Endomicrobiales bacterium]
MQKALKSLVLTTNRAIIEILRTGLGRGHTILQASNKFSAIETLKKEEEFDFVVVDTRTPGVESLNIKGILKNIDESIQVLYLDPYSLKLRDAGYNRRLGTVDFTESGLKSFFNRLRSKLKIRRKPGQHRMPDNVSGIIKTTAEYIAEKETGLKPALRTFRQIYIDMLVGKHQEKAD